MKGKSYDVAETRQELALLLTLFVSLRLFVQFVSRPQGFVLDASDYNFYLDVAKLSDRGLYPFVDFWLEYPPVFPWVAVAAYRLTESIPLLNGSPLFWFRLTLGGIVLVFDVANLLLIYGLASTFQSPARAMRIAWTYALLFTPLHVWLGWFDTMPLFFLLLSLYLWVKGKTGWAAAAAGFGMMVKITPVLALPLILKHAENNRKRVWLAGIAATSALVVAAPFLITGPQYLIASFQSIFSRSPWGTPWAVMEGYFSFGKVAPLPERIDQATAISWQAYESRWPWMAITAIFAVVFLILWTRRVDTSKPFIAIAFTGLVVNLFLLYSKGFSPQFILYVVPFALLLLPPLRAVGYLTAFALLGLVEYPLYHTILPEDHWIIWEVVWVRTGLLVLLSWEFLQGLALTPSLEKVRRPLVALVMLAFVVWSAALLPRLGQSWHDQSLANHPSAPLIEYLAMNAGTASVVVFTEPGLYRELYPFLNGRTNIVLIDPYPPESAISTGAGVSAAGSGQADELDQLLAIRGSYSEVYSIYRQGEPPGERLERYLTREPGFIGTQRLNGISVTLWSRTDWGSEPERS